MTILVRTGVKALGFGQSRHNGSALAGLKGSVRPISPTLHNEEASLPNLRRSAPGEPVARRGHEYITLFVGLARPAIARHWGKDAGAPWRRSPPI
jgi:hypothetical protein